VFPGLSDGHGTPVDVWSLGVIVLEGMYGISTPPDAPKPKKKKTITSEQWDDWVGIWATQLVYKLDDEEEGQVIEILVHMIEIEVGKRWHAKKCLAQGFDNGLFKRRKADGLVVCARDPDDLVLLTEGGEDGTMTPTVASPSVGALLPQSQASIDPGATVILGNI